jgi:RNA polymerase sigma-70 factor (family 1)
MLPGNREYHEKELLQLIAGGDEQAFRRLFLQWSQLLAGYILKITESKELTEEIVQDVFMNIWVVRETLPQINNFKHFLIVVSRNQAFDVLKKQLREQERRKTWEKENATGTYIQDAEPGTLRSSVIEQAIDSLPPRRKEIYLLSRHERLTYQEIGARLGISKESVKTHLKLATVSISTFIRAHLTELSLLVIAFLKNIYFLFPLFILFESLSYTCH